jgi:multidrug efflux system membrane fusion protein
MQPNTPSKEVGSVRRRTAVLLLILALPPAAMLMAGCNQGPPPAPKKEVSVIVTRPIKDVVTDYQDFTGRLDALMTVDIRSRVSGYIVEAPFKEGDYVHEGDLLFQIDRRPFEAALNQAVANLNQARADENLQEKNARRAHALIGSNAISKEDYDTMIATAEKSKATTGAMEAAREMAQINLDWTRVVAPLSGRVSRRNVDPGNLAAADNTVLTTLVSDDPMYAYFDVDERTYLNLSEAAARKAGKATAADRTATVPGINQASLLKKLKLPVQMELANEQEFSHAGQIDFIDNRVNASTGTIRMRGVFPNPAGRLKSGLFVRIRLPIGEPREAVLIPDEALLSDQGRKYVYVVNDKKEVAYRAVTVAQQIETLRVINKGLNGDEQVLVSGMQRVRPGTPVEVKEQAPPRPPSSLAKSNLPRAAQAKGEGDGQESDTP